MKRKLYQHIASTLSALRMSVDRGNEDWVYRHRERLESLQSLLPSGSGFDCGTTIDFDSGPHSGAIELSTSFHHMDEHGGYAGWSHFDVAVSASLTCEIHLEIDIINTLDTDEYDEHFEDYVYEVFSHCLTEMVEETYDEQTGYHHTFTRYNKEQA